MELFLLCLKIFVCRIIDVSMASYRTVIMVKGKSLMASLIALVEGAIWFLVVRDALNFISTNMLDTLLIALAYSGGFATGTFVGSSIASKFIKGMIQVQVVTSNKDDELIHTLQDNGFALTVVTSNATTFSGEKYLIFSEIMNSKLHEFKKLIFELDPKAFVMVNETKHVINGFIKK